jgi:hypothetical protein
MKRPFFYEHKKRFITIGAQWKEEEEEEEEG